MQPVKEWEDNARTINPETGHLGCSSGTQTSPLKSVSSFRYAGDVKSDVLYSPNTSKRAIEKCLEKIQEQKGMIKKQKVSITRLKKKVEGLDEILRDFRDKRILSDSAHETLDVRYLFLKKRFLYMIESHIRFSGLFLSHFQLIIML